MAPTRERTLGARSRPCGARRGGDARRRRRLRERHRRPIEGQERLFGARASETTTHRVLKSVDERVLERIRAARAAARARVWDAGARPQIDHAEHRRDAGRAPIRRRSGRRATTSTGSGFIRSAATWTRPARRSPRSCAQATPGRTPRPITSRCSRWRSSSCPPEDLDREILVRADIGGATHAFCADCRDADDPLLGRLRAQRQRPRGDPRAARNARGCRRSTPTARPARVRGSPS